MPSANAIAIMAGAAAGGIGAGRLGWRSSGRNPDMDQSDRMAFTASSAVAGIAGGAAIAKIGPGRIAAGMKNLAMGTFRSAQAARGVGKGVSAAASKMGAGKAPWLKGPMKLLALTAASIGVMAYGARSKTPTSAYASRNEAGEMEYGQRSVRDRMDMMGVTGDMVFGMNNTRHG